MFYAEVDGKRILHYQEPFAPQGAAHRHFAVARFHNYGSAELRILRVCTRIAPRYVDILEPGRVLLRAGHRQEAAAWFRRVADEYPGDALQQDASYLAALAVPDEAREAKEQAFRQAARDAEQSVLSTPVAAMGAKPAASGGCRRRGSAGPRLCTAPPGK